MQIKYIMYCLLILKLVSTEINVSAQVDTQPEIDSLTQVLRKTKDINEKKLILKTLSNRYQDKGNWEKYEEVVEQMLHLHKEQPDSFYLAETYNKLGISNCILGQNKKALDYFQKALEINLAQKMDLIAANSYENLGVVYNDMANFDKAVDCQLKSLELRRKKNSDRIFNNYLKLAMLHEQIGDIKKEDEFLDLAKQEMQKQDSITPRNKALFYNQLGDIYKTRELNDSSIICYRRVILFSNQIGWKKGIAAGLGNLAEVYYEEGALDSAIFYNKQSLRLSKEIADGIGTTEEYRRIAKLYSELGKHDSVLFYATNALQKAKEFDLLEEQSDVLKFMADYYNTQGNFKQAYTFLEQHHTAVDSISSAEVKKNVAELNTKYETKVKEQQIELLTSEIKIKNQRMWLFVAATISLLLAFLIGIFFYIRKKKENTQRQEMLKQQLLRSQMNPHFLFNALGSIQNFMLKNETKRAAGYLNNFASLTRNILEHSAQEFVSVSEEIETLSSYIELEKMRLENKFEFEITYDKNLETDFINIPPMLIQPFVENAIKHGLNNIDYKGVLELKFEDKGTVLHIEIIDNGVGIDSTKLNKSKKHRSMSMNIFEQRRIVLAKRTKQAIGLEVINRNSLNTNQTGTLVKIEIPIIS
ncbi:MAG: tetratricopeptide repeat protein [Bacteroidetes bacterium]|nr:tetratricopeptide repeat protein [Bacteroidota bacterium]